MKTILKRFIFIISIFCLSPLSSVFGQTFDFSGTPKIRVYISAAPGMGHQSASIVVMRRLRQVGFKGTFDVVYDDSIASKLPSLLPSFDPQLKGRQILGDLKIEAISESHFFAQESIEQVNLALTGADDNRRHMTPERLRSDRYLLMEPMGWGDSFYFDGKKAAQVLPSLRSLGYYFQTETSALELEKSYQTLSHEGQAARAAGLKTLLQADAHFAAVYGIGTIPLMVNKMKYWVQSLERAGRSQKLQKPLILPIISPQNQFEKLTLEHALQDIQFPESLKNKPRIILKDLADPNLQAEIGLLKKGDILLVSVGRIPQNIFEKFFEKSDLPVLVAGKNAMNLAQNLGKVYINTVNDANFPQNTETFKLGVEQSTQAHKIFVNAKGSDRDLRFLVQYIKDSLNPNSDLSKMHQSFSQRDSDKVSEALRLLKFSETGITCQSVF